MSELSVKFLFGKELASECTYALSLKRRRVYYELENNYINASDVCNKVGIVRGLRNTGKTIILLQLAGRREFVLQSAYTTLGYRNEADVASLCKEIDTLYRKHGIKYFYIDEVTWAEGFVDMAADFSDSWATGNTVKIVLSGTDSLGFAFAAQHELHHRYREVLTTYMGYAEYHDLLGGNVIDFIRSGGVFWGNDTSSAILADYLNTSVVANIYNSIHNVSRIVPAATQLIGLTEDGLYSLCYAICKYAVLSMVCEKAERIWGDSFSKAINDAFGQSRRAIREAIGDNTFSLTMHEKQIILSALGKSELYAGVFSMSQINAAITLMKMCGFLCEVGSYSEQGPDSDDTELVFAQSGVAREFVRMVLHGIAMSDVFPASNISAILQAIEENTDGMILESACMSAFIRKVELIGTGVKLFKYRAFDGSHEIDIVALDYRTGVMHLFEVKRSDGKPDETGRVDYVEDFARRHLTVETCTQPLMERFKPSSMTRTVLFRGEDSDKTIDGHIVSYRNIAKYLQQLEDGLVL
ncbi:MAG: AAA family ATPase [Oscillospiraceae bacterium]|jgi:predicted AAA+ superfamily ATPase|nr:AAA family ATPase [Oscillospiraceae bacterium]